MFFSSLKIPTKLMVSFVALTALLGTPDAYCTGGEKETKSPATTAQKPIDTIDQEKARANAGNLSILAPEVLELVFMNIGIKTLAEASLVCKYFLICAKAPRDAQYTAHLNLARGLAQENDATFEKLKNTSQEKLQRFHTIASCFVSQKSSVVDKLLEASSEQLQIIKGIEPLLFSDTNKENVHYKTIARILTDKNLHQNYAVAAAAFFDAGTLSFFDGANQRLFYKKAGEMWEKEIDLLGDKVTPEDYARAGTSFSSMATFSSDKVAVFQFYKKAGEMWEKKIDLLGDKVTPEDYVIPFNYFIATASTVSDLVGRQCQLYKIAGKLWEKKIDFLGDKVTPEDYEIAYKVFYSAVWFASEETEKGQLKQKVFQFENLWRLSIFRVCYGQVLDFNP